MSAKPEQQLPPAQRALARLTGARLCFGRPVEVKGRTVIPVASVRTMGGYGFGNEPARGAGGGGGGALDARPVGFIEIGPDGTRFEPIDDGRAALRLIAAGSLALLVVGRVLVRRRRGALERGPSRPRLRRGRAQESQAA
ncbi:MAG: GerW family sporulation protein [Solirubrobacteraceae bacterium]|jgi:uncharacterized spore protein YtfJ